jgi:hypothetical protein
LVDLWEGRGSREYEMDDIMLLKVGRHIRPKPTFKLIIARDAGESKFLEGYRKQYPSVHAVSHNGPLALIDGKFTEEDSDLVAAIVARYGQGRDAEEVEVKISPLAADSYSVKVPPAPVEEVLVEWHV